ncbi:alkylglycerol monooxygenase-like [Oppia nitens]|uniref:alkylglycerol monooxygenase-like n=1 Tax=Oppia nitens TaxID=1686743 RepID=UPI0023DC5AC6|nr:alkylglycerol monooxygenase-like [Oppia nitens]
MQALRKLFYLVLPSECMYPDIKLVPRYVEEMFPIFVSLIVAENAVRLLKGKSILRINDSIASLGQGVFQECLRLNLRSFEVVVYCFVYENFRIITMQWDSLWTWWYCLILIDFGFYWAHRLAHEVNFIWAIHQAHHSAEDFTLIAGLRQAVLQPFTAWITYVPLALSGIPPPIFLAHLQLGELYMLWLHTEVVQTLGPLELVLNSPSHHRVHHARNRKYVDKNYSGIFILWDRMFRTFEPEDPNEPVVYGLVKPVQSYNPFYLQIHHWITIFKNMYHMDGWKNKLLILFKGPGWAPGKPRLGYLDDIPALQQPVEYWDPKIPLLQKLYTIWHFAVVLIFYHELNQRHHELNQLTILLCILALLVSITSIGFLLENKKYSLQFEIVRCLLFFVAERHIWPVTQTMLQTILPSRYIIIQLLRLTYLLSAIICTVIEFHRISLKVLSKENMKKMKKIS